MYREYVEELLNVCINIWVDMKVTSFITVRDEATAELCSPLVLSHESAVFRRFILREHWKMFMLHGL